VLPLIASRQLDLISLSPSGSAVFCALDWSQQQRDPSSVPMHKDLLAASGCGGPGRGRQRSYSLSLSEAAAHAREQDALAGLDPGAVLPGGFVFHESRCGSTLVANLLAGGGAAPPEESRVYSESSPIVAACQNPAGCDEGLLRDAVYVQTGDCPSAAEAG
jgi:hypothetical protein